MEQREIKFRAWDKERKEMLLSNKLYHLEGELSKALKEQSPFLEIMQFTGLKDKNGKEIYEGDILSFEKYEGTKHQMRWEIVFNPLKPYKTWYSTDDDAIIIGNIYENPELLK